ncbi:putative P-loop containing nucleoside triphosphate hydrolase, leucine-rich repeat domain superfamily [Helianthus annuus]|nr:putative P-loop containing nucleoside triphosphate hydrolase, leucine-rich repeat domain superfamily [Helianthus annuus]
MWTNDNVDRWMTAFMEISNSENTILSSSFRSETEYVKHVIDTIYCSVTNGLVYPPLNLIGIDGQVKEINFLLEKPDAEFLAICGMGGSGKTTLARYIFNLFKNNFENSSFLEEIGKWGNDLLQLQKTLLQDLSGSRKIKLQSVDDCILELEEVVQTKKALIVLDDIVQEDQLVSLLGTGNINKQSKIIVTSRDASIKTWIGFRSWRFQEYKMKLLNDGDALDLFSLHAFGSQTPMEGYKELTKEALNYCEGNPAALEVLGSSLSGRSISEWEHHLRNLGRGMFSRFYDVLVTSYNSLCFSDKNLFLDIACFFTGEEMDYVAKILGHDYSVVSGIDTLLNKHLLSVSQNKKLTMHRLHQEMGRTIVNQESKYPPNRSRVWRDKESYEFLREGKGSKFVQGLALDMRKLCQEDEQVAFQSTKLTTDALKQMDNLELLLLKFVPLTGSYDSFSENLRLLCWHGFHLRAIPLDLYMGNMVAIDMSYSKLEEFDPPMILQSLRILNLKGSNNLLEVRNLYLIPKLESLILSNCHMLVHVCETLGDLTNITLLDMTKCEKLFKGNKSGALSRLVVSTFNRICTKENSFFLPHPLEQLFLKDCNLGNTNYFPLSLSNQSILQYLNLGNNMFEFLPSYSHLINLRVLDLTMCSKLKRLLSLPSTLAELYISYCESLEKVTFESYGFTLQEFECQGCISLSEIEGIIKLVPVAKLDENCLGHMKWLKVYQDREVCLVGNNELTIGRNCRVQMLYEFGIMSTSLPDTKDPNMTQYISDSSSLCFDVPQYPKNRRLKGLNVTFKYTLSGDNSVWFAKVSTNNGVDLMYNPTVFGKPGSGEVGIWFSYWPIGNKFDTGDTVTVSIVVMSGLEVIECGASLVYTYDIPNETMESNMGYEETLGVDLSGFQLSTGAYYLCHHDFFKFTEVNRLAPDWFRILVGDKVDETELQRWKISGRPKQAKIPITEWS